MATQDLVPVWFEQSSAMNVANSAVFGPLVAAVVVLVIKGILVSVQLVVRAGQEINRGYQQHTLGRRHRIRNEEMLQSLQARRDIAEPGVMPLTKKRARGKS